jgi:redox-regulated HSP33 family molecular chaperone
LKSFIEENRIHEYFCACSQNIIHDLLVMLLEQDIPTNYEEKMADINARNDLESWNPIK